MTEEPAGSGWRRTLWIAAAVAALAALVWLTPLRDVLAPARAGEWLRTARESWWAPIAFVILYTGFNILLVPATILTVTAGVVWGWKAGAGWVLVASTIGSAAPYFLARAGSGPAIAAIRRRSARLSETLENEGFLTLLLLRLIPIVPYNLLNYAAGIAGLRPRDFIAATFLGTIPGIVIVTYLADSIAQGLVTPGEAFLRILLAGTLLAALVVISRIFAGRVRRRLER